jgi:NAD-dependent SIR2 family protein deacetylase
MRIIGKGIPQDPKMHGSCDTCYCEIECTLSETQRLTDEQRPGWSALYVKCPNCHDQHLFVDEIEDN